MDLFRLVNRFNIRENLATVKKAGAGRLRMAMGGEQKTLPRNEHGSEEIAKIAKIAGIAKIEKAKSSPDCLH